MRAGCIYLQAQEVRQFGERVVLQLPQVVPRQVPEIYSVTSSCSDVGGKWECPQLTRYIDNRILFYFLKLICLKRGMKNHSLLCVMKKSCTLVADSCNSTNEML
jgi:hypothetical protein